MIAQKPFESGPVIGFDPDRGIDREDAAVAPLCHVLCVILVEIALTDEPAKHPLSNPCLHPLDIGVGEHRLAETHGLLASLVRLEYTVDHTTVKMQMLIDLARVLTEPSEAGIYPATPGWDTAGDWRIVSPS